MNGTNSYGYKDPTAVEAITNIIIEQRRKENEQEITKKAYEKWLKSQELRKKKQKTRSRNM